jgi:hypothetical protein
LFRTKRFFRSLSVDAPPDVSSGFGHFHRAIAAFVLGLAIWLHVLRLGFFVDDAGSTSHWQLFALAFTCTFVFVELLTAIVSRLTTWEAGYRGYRLPRPIVDRALDYHAVHLLPPALLGLAIAAAYTIFERYDPNLAASHIVSYLYTLCIGVIISAFYLFVTYWAGMRKLLYANKRTPAIDAAGAATRQPEKTP